MSNLFIVEIRKLFLSFYFWIILILSSALSILIPLDSHGVITNFEVIGVSFYNSCLLIIMCILLAGVYFGSDFAYGTIKNFVSAGHGRLEIFICKMCTCFLGICAVVLTGPVISIIKAELYDKLYIDSIVLLKTMAAESLSAMAVCSTCIFICIIFKNVGKCIGISSVLYFINVYVLNSAGNLKESYVKYCPLAQMRLVLLRPLYSGQFKEAFIIAVMTCLLFSCLTYFYFKNEELN